MELKTTYKFLGYNGFGNPVVIKNEIDYYNSIDGKNIIMTVSTEQIDNEPAHGPEYMAAPKASIDDLELIDSVS